MPKSLKPQTVLLFCAVLLASLSASAFDFPASARPAAQARSSNEAVLSEIVVHGNRRIPTETIRSRMSSRPGDILDPQVLERDFHSLWNSGYFDDLRFEREDTAKGALLHVYVKEKPTIGEVKYVGLNSMTQSDLLDEFKKRKVNVTQESQYDPTRVMHARAVLKEMLAAHGHQFADVRPEVRQMSASRVSVTFIIKEGTKVKVGKITFEGNKAVRSRDLRAAMKGARPIGVPHSIFLENLWARTFNADRLSDDTELVREALQNRGFYKATVEYPQTTMKDTGHKGFHIPLIQHGPGKAVDIHFTVEEGERYHVSGIDFSGNKAIANNNALRAQFPLRDGDLFNIDKLRSGIKNLKDQYAAAGYINFTAIPQIEPDDEKKLVHIKIEIEEGKQFSVRRIEFSGNTTTRDKVIRRELILDEGSLYNQKYWEFSVLRLNQLGYFNKIDPERDTTVSKDEAKGTVDLGLKVSEKQKNQIGLSGGISGLEGSFIGMNYSTNNLLGKGETLSIAVNLGNISRSASFGFSEPYLFDRPIQTGFTVYGQKFNYNQAQQLNILYGRNLNIPSSEQALLTNYNTSSFGFSTYASYQLPRSLKRVGLTYAFDVTSITPFSTVSQITFEQLSFRNINGPSALNGITTSHVQPSFTFDTVNARFNPTGGHQFALQADVAGLGGNTRYVKPIVDWKQFVNMKGLKPRSKADRSRGRTTLAYHVTGAFITGYAGLGPAPWQRMLMGGEQDLRGFDIRTISPVVFIPVLNNVPLVSPADPCLASVTLTCPTSGFGIPVNPGNSRAGTVSVPLATYQILPYVGGDTEGWSNLEYRITIVPEHVVLSAFTDVGTDGIVRPSQVKIASSALAQLNGTALGCPYLDPNQTNGCGGGALQTFGSGARIVSATNWQPRMSNGLELQLLLPVINAPFRIYYAFNTLRLNDTINSPNPITRNMFPAGAAGNATFLRTQSLFAPNYRMEEPQHTFRFTVATTF
ncbi:MAG: outer membrane protein assembly factor BamA [Acidobacteria bacterium]|nr:outer membrane protein assembly factor BamA [Acidobacteriota bacterium]